MLAGILRGISMAAMLALFMWTHDRYLLLACALCTGAVLGHELHWGQWTGGAIFALLAVSYYGTLGLHGAVMTSSFFPVSVSVLQGFVYFLMMVAVGAYFMWEVERTMDAAEDGKERADARR